MSMLQDNSPGNFRGDFDTESLGIPQFSSDTGCYITLNGLIMQGGKVEVTGVGVHDVPFLAPFRQQLISLQLTRCDVANHLHIVSASTDLEQFRVNVTGGTGALFYWFAIGV